MAQNINDLLNLDPYTISKMTEKELRSAVTVLKSAANKRLRSLETAKLGKESYAYQAVAKKAGEGNKVAFPSTTGRTYNQLQNEYKEIRAFMGMKTSNRRGWSQAVKRVENLIESDGGEPRQISEDEWRDYWRLYREWEEKGLYALGYSSTTLQTQIANLKFKDNKSDAEIHQIFTSAYEKKQEEWSPYDDTFSGAPDELAES